MEFGEDGSYGKDVHWRAIRLAAEEDLRGPVPSRGDVVGQRMATADLSGQAKVGELAGVAGAQEVLRLQVAMEVALLVDVGEPLEDLGGGRYRGEVQISTGRTAWTG